VGEAPKRRLFRRKIGHTRCYYRDASKTQRKLRSAQKEAKKNAVHCQKVQEKPERVGLEAGGPLGESVLASLDSQ